MLRQLAAVGLGCFAVTACANAHKPPAVSGASVFAHTCSSCHSLVGNESLRKQGGDLIAYRMTRAQLLDFTRVMPTRPLSRAELDAVVDYVLRAQAARRR